MATLRTSTSNTETAVLYSRGPDKDPFSMYSTTNSVLHDLKKPLSSAPALKPPMEMGGFARNNLPTAAKEAPDVPNPRTLGRTFNRLIDDPTAPVHSQSLSAASFAMGSTTLGERSATEQQFGFLRDRSGGGFNNSVGGAQRSIRSADATLAAGGLGLDEVDGADIVAAIATQRAKRSGTGFTTNTVKPPPTAQDRDLADVTHPGTTTMLAKAVRGRTDPLARENDFKGPAPMSTTQRASFVPHPDVDPDLLEPGAFLDLEARRVATCGSLKNRAPTLHHQPHDGWRPSTESRDAYVRPDLASDPHETITYATLAKRKSIPKHRSAQSAVSPVGDEFADAPTQLTYLQEQKLKHSDPIGYDVYMRQDPWVTTSRATHDGRPDPNRTTVDDVMATNATARRVLNASLGSNGSLDRGLLVSTLSGAPHKKPASGFATNNASDPPHEPSEFNNPQKLSIHQTATARVSRRLENEGDIQMSIYQSEFRDQLRLPPPAGQFRELRKYTSGFERCNKDNMFASDEGTEDPERWKRKV